MQDNVNNVKKDIQLMMKKYVKKISLTANNIQKNWNVNIVKEDISSWKIFVLKKFKIAKNIRIKDANSVNLGINLRIINVLEDKIPIA